MCHHTTHLEDFLTSLPPEASRSSFSPFHCCILLLWKPAADLPCCPAYRTPAAIVSTTKQAGLWKGVVGSTYEKPELIVWHPSDLCPSEAPVKSGVPSRPGAPAPLTFIKKHSFSTLGTSSTTMVSFLVCFLLTWNCCFNLINLPFSLLVRMSSHWMMSLWPNSSKTQYRDDNARTTLFIHGCKYIFSSWALVTNFWLFYTKILVSYLGGLASSVGRWKCWSWY